MMIRRRRRAMTSSSNFQAETQPYRLRNILRAKKPPPAPDPDAANSPNPDPGWRPLHLHPKWKTFLKLLSGTLYVTPAEHRPPFLELLKEADLL